MSFICPNISHELIQNNDSLSSSNSKKINIYIHKYFCEHSSSGNNANKDNYAHM